MGKDGGGSPLTGIVIRVFVVLIVIATVGIGIALGLAMAETANIMNQENFVEFAPALPTRILDINGELVTEFSADEKRELVSLNELPRHLINAVLAREDPDFYNHRGFSLRGIMRAAFGQLVLHRNLGGGSTITQQVAGTLYTDRSEKTISRKIRELWWAFQIERRYTKNEILEIYLNYMYMGPGVYGVEAASKYFFGHSARDITLAESAILVIQLSNPSRYNPLDNPNVARDRQLAVLDRMIEFGYCTKEEAEASFNEYWDNYDYTRASTSAYYNRDDKAPWFSEYVRRELDRLMYGTMDYYRDGYTVHTTLDLRHQEAARKYMEQGLARANREFSSQSSVRLVEAERTYIPIVDMLSLYFNLGGIHSTGDAQNEQKAMARYVKTLNPVVDMAALAFGINDIKVATNKAFSELKTTTEQNVVEGALICIENETGYITALIGGSRYDEANQLIRATQAKVMPGSSFKPLYYSAAIDSKKFTASSLIYDVPIVFHNENGTPYIPLNFRGEWKGTVLLYDALAQSMNVPSLKILDGIGFDAAIDRAAALLGIVDPDEIRRTFPRVYPMGLGIIAVAPIQIARAFSIFSNQGREVTPIAIRSIDDRNGKVVMDIERDLRLEQRRKGAAIQVISPQNAWIMTSILKKTVEYGTLANASGWGSKFTFKDENGKSFRMPAAGKTGTTQNWSDAWAVGFTPYYTTALWFGFDKPGNSLGLSLTGATLAGPLWADYMREIHQGFAYRDFSKPSTGIIDVTVCAKSGMLKTPACDEGEVTMPFLEGTQPTQYCTLHGTASFAESAMNTMRGGTLGMDDEALLGGLSMPTLDPSLFPDIQPMPSGQNRSTRTNTYTAPGGSGSNSLYRGPSRRGQSTGNPFLDDDDYDLPPLSAPGGLPPLGSDYGEQSSDDMPAASGDAADMEPPGTGYPPGTSIEADDSSRAVNDAPPSGDAGTPPVPQGTTGNPLLD